MSKPIKSLFVKLVSISKDRWQLFVIDMTEVEEDSDSVEEGEVWEDCLQELGVGGEDPLGGQRGCGGRQWW